jgi:hypothetical protein
MITFRSPDGARVTVIQVTHTSDHSDGQWYRVTDRHGLYAGQTRSVTGLADLGINIKTLTEEHAP